MGRYMRKNKVTMEVSQSSLGVRTRARTLAMAQQERRRQQEQQQQQQQQQQEQQQKQKQSKQVNVLNFCYLELRSRKLEKFFEANSSKRHKPSRPPKQRPVDAIGVVTISRSSSFSSSKQQQQQQQSGLVLPKVEEQNAAAIPSSEAPGLPESCLELRTGEIEVSCGDNAFDHDGHSSRDSFDHARRLRESTPVCNEHEMEAPGSSSRVRIGMAAANHQNPSSRHLDIPSPEEIEDFFAGREEADEEKSRLSDRYNYDFINDVPLPGRFEWTPASL